MKSIIVLLIDHDAYKAETGKRLTSSELNRQGKFVAEDAAGMYGLEGWQSHYAVAAASVKVPLR